MYRPLLIASTLAAGCATVPPMDCTDLANEIRLIHAKEGAMTSNGVLVINAESQLEIETLEYRMRRMDCEIE